MPASGRAFRQFVTFQIPDGTGSLSQLLQQRLQHFVSTSKRKARTFLRICLPVDDNADGLSKTCKLPT